MGLVHLAAAPIKTSYGNSVNCVKEAVFNSEGKGNAYCDGKKKSGKVNCSWFNGIKHSESFHTHK